MQSVDAKDCQGTKAYCDTIRSLPVPYPEPQAIFVLGGDREREAFAVEMARAVPIDLWLSSGQNDADRLMAVPWLRHRLHLDWRALDTVTNFSTMIPNSRPKCTSRPVCRAARLVFLQP